MADQAASSPTAEISAIKVLDHVHDEVACVYRIVVGSEIYVPEHLAEVPVLDDEGQYQYDEDEDGMTHLRTTAETIPDTVLGHTSVQDYIFADDDDRWFDASGNRRPDSDVSAEQKQIVKEAVEAAAAEAAAQAEPPRELPGVGEEL